MAPILSMEIAMADQMPEHEDHFQTNVLYRRPWMRGFGKVVH